MALLKQVIEVDGVKMLADACCCGGTSGGSGSEGPSGPVFVTTPELTLADKLEIGASADLGMTAMAGLNGAYIERFEIIVGDAGPVEVSAEGNAATYAFSVGGKAGDILSISVVAVDNYGNRSAPAHIEAACCIVKFPVYGVTGGYVWRSLDNGLTWERCNTASDICAVCVLDDGTVVACRADTDSSSHLWLVKSRDFGETWTALYLPGKHCTPRSMCQAADGSIIVAGMLGTAWNSDKTPVIWRSEDGEVFTQVDVSQYLDYWFGGAVVASNGTIILSGGEEGSPDTSGSVSMPTGRGVFLYSADAGKTWTHKVVSAFSTGNFARQLFLRTMDGTLYTAGTISNPKVSAQSIDNGITWTSVTSEPDVAELFWNFSSGGGVLHGAGVNSYMRSMDSGATWEAGNLSKPICIAAGPAIYATA